MVTVYNNVSQRVEAMLARIGVSDPTDEQIRLMQYYASSEYLLTDVGLGGKLSCREESCLYWTALGKTSSEIAKRLDIKKSTVDGYKKSIMKKMNCSNMTHCVFTVMQLNFLRDTELERQ